MTIDIDKIGKDIAGNSNKIPTTTRWVSMDKSGIEWEYVLWKQENKNATSARLEVRLSQSKS